MTLDCRNCHESLAEPVIFDEVFLAIECPVCGVRGPIRPLFSPERFDQVAKLAMDDWIYLFNFESNETNGAGKAVTPSVEKPVLDKPVPSQAVTTPPAGEGGEGDSVPNTREEAPIDAPASSAHSTTRAAKMAASLNGWPDGRNESDSVEQQALKPSGDGDGERAGLSQEQVRKRLRSFLLEVGMGVDAALSKGFELGTSKATLYRFLEGFKARTETVEKISAALDKLEGNGLAKVSSDTPIEVLPNNFAPITGANRTAPPTAPPRCGRTP